jgi:hypothetical protein
MQPELISITFTGPVEGSQVFELAEWCRIRAALLGLAPMTMISVRGRPAAPSGETSAPAAAP